MATANQLLPSKFILDMAINVDVKTIIFYLPGKQPTLTEQLKTLSENRCEKRGKAFLDSE